MINCLQDELIKVRLREAENEESIRNLGEKVSELEEVCIFFLDYIVQKIIPPWKCLPEYENELAFIKMHTH